MTDSAWTAEMGDKYREYKETLIELIWFTHTSCDEMEAWAVAVAGR